MFKKLYNEALIEFDIETISPLFIKSGDEDRLTPTAAENSYLSVYKNGKEVPVIPGTSFKGVFRSRAEEMLKIIDPNIYVCDIFKDGCDTKISKSEKKSKGKSFRFNGKEKYEKSCAVCKLFGSKVLKSRIQFQDAYPIGEYRIGKRQSVAIDRITGASKKGALFDFEYVEYGKFRGKIRLKNFFPWQLKLLFNIFKDVNDGFVNFGGLTSKGFGKMKVTPQKVLLRYYDKSRLDKSYEEKDFYGQKIIEGEEEINILIQNIELNNSIIQGCDLENDKAI